MNFIKTVSLEKAPILLRWSAMLRWFMVILPIIILFYQDKGLTTGQFFLIQGLFSVFNFFLEIPTGYIGDLFSRRKVIIFSFMCYLIGTIVLYFAYGFYLVLLGEVFFAFSMAFASGTNEAYLYDVLKKQNKEKDAIKEQGKVSAYMLYGTAAATFIGGFLYKIMGTDIILIEVVLIAVGLAMTLFLPELEDVKRVVKEGKSKWQDIIDIAKYASTHHEIKWLMLFPSLFGAGTLVLFWTQQPLMQNNAVPVYLFGIFMGMNQLFRAILSHGAHKLFKFLKTKWYTISAFLILFTGLITAFALPSIKSIYATYAMLIVVGFATASQAGLSIVMKSMINHRIKSDERATVLSVSSMISQLFNGVVMISLKFLIDEFGLQFMYSIIAPLILILTFISMAKLLKLKI
ncbi:MAG: MFS transporter [Alphaproteobacteria bacterium]|nr:MFS transporter [Alphaproteobacteria bacterium]